MGCWNGSCFLSNLSISSRDKIKLQLIIEVVHSNKKSGFDLDAYESSHDPREINGMCYPTDQYEPVAFPITGVYNDYGSINSVVKDEAYDMLVLAIKTLMIEERIVCLQDVDTWLSRNRTTATKQEKIQTIDPTDIKKFIDDVERGLIIVKNWSGIWVRLNFVMMHAETYKNALSLVTYKELDEAQAKILEVYYGDVENDEVFEDPAHKLMKDISSALLKYEDTNDSARKTANDTLLLIKDLKAKTAWMKLVHRDITSFDIDELKESVGHCGKEKAIKIIELFANSRRMYDVLYMTRRVWNHASGCGSQNENEDFVEKFLKKNLQFATKYKKALKKRYA